MQTEYRNQPKPLPESPEETEERLIKKFFKIEADIAKKMAKSSTYIDLADSMREKVELLKSLNELKSKKK